MPNPRAGILKKSRPKGQSKPTARVDPSFHTPVPAISPPSYVPYQAGEKRKGVASSSIADSSSDADMESVDGVDDHPSSAEAGPVKAELLVGQYVQVSSSSTKQEYKNRIFRISSVGIRSSHLEYLDDFETTKKPNVVNHLLFVPSSSPVYLNEYRNLKVQRPGDPYWTHIPSAGPGRSEASSTGAVAGNISLTALKHANPIRLPNPLVSFDATIHPAGSSTPVPWYYCASCSDSPAPPRRVPDRLVPAGHSPGCGS